MFANTQMMGMDMAFPDVCLTPTPPSPSPVPVPYPNTAIAPTANPGTACQKTFINMMPVHNLRTQIPMTQGDNPGIGTGVASGRVMGPSRHLTGAFTVIFEGMPASRMTSLSIQNGTNALGMRMVPSQTKVLLLAP